MDYEQQQLLNRKRELANWIASGLAEKDLQWATEILNRVQSVVVLDTNKPCDYAPWSKAFEEIGIAQNQVSAISYKAGKAIWPEDDKSFREFALTFLEVDLMGRNSGYIKGYLIARLGRSNLAEKDIQRLSNLIKRAVTKGTGRDEYRQYKRLAAKIHPPGLLDWLRQYSQGAQLVSDFDLDIEDRMLLWDRFSELEYHSRFVIDSDLERLIEVYKKRLGVPWYKIELPNNRQSKEQQIARNAWRIHRRMIKSLRPKGGAITLLPG